MTTSQGATADRFVLAIASGKGGTGKTLLATNISAAVAGSRTRVLLADCDVEAPNDHLFFALGDQTSTSVEVPVAEVDASLCAACGACRDACAFGAVRILGGSAIVFEELCHGCGVCTDACDAAAIHEVPRRVGETLTARVKDREGLSIVTGTLDVGQVKSPSVIRAVRDVAARTEADLVVLDAPPGVACSAVAAIRGADALLLVTEPTAFGLHDLELSLRLGRSLGLPMGVAINREGTGHADVEALCRDWDVPIVARIPFDRKIAGIYARGALVADELPDFARLAAELPAKMRQIAHGAARR